MANEALSPVYPAGTVPTLSGLYKTFDPEDVANPVKYRHYSDGLHCWSSLWVREPGTRGHRVFGTWATPAFLPSWQGLEAAPITPAMWQGVCSRVPRDGLVSMHRIMSVKAWLQHFNIPDHVVSQLATHLVKLRVVGQKPPIGE